MLWSCPVALRVSQPLGSVLATACRPAGCARQLCRHKVTSAAGHRQARAGSASRLPAAAARPVEEPGTLQRKSVRSRVAVAAAASRPAELRSPQQTGLDGKFFQSQQQPGDRQFVVDISPKKASMGKSKNKDSKAHSNAKAGACYLQVLGLGTDTGLCTPSVLLFFDQQRYLFNAGEGIQRFCGEYKIRPSRLSGVFLTRCTPAAMGGLAGLCLTVASFWNVQDHGTSPSYEIYGPQGLKTVLDSMGSYADTRVLKHRATEVPPGPGAADSTFSTDSVSITPVILSLSQIEAAASAHDGHEDDSAQQPAKRQRSLDSSEPADLPSTAHHSQAEGSAAQQGTAESTAQRSVPDQPDVACYICQLPDIPGKFDPGKAAALGVPKGSQFGVLQRGKAVTTPQGTQVLPDQVMGPTTPGPAALIVDCPSSDYVPALTSHPAFSPWLGGGKSAAVIVHLAPYEVVQQQGYQAWMQRFGDEAKHLVVNSAATGGPPVFKSACRLQARLNLVSTSMFPLLWVAGHAAPDRPAAAPVSEQTPRNMTQFWLRPAAKIGTISGGEEPLVSAHSVINTLREQQPATYEALAAGRLDSSRSAETSGREGQTPRFAPDVAEVTVLGTGAASPSKYRNVTGVYLDLFQRGSAFIDCGEASLSQLGLALGPEGLRQALAKLRFVWISHMHADHHVGLAGVLHARRGLLGPDAPLLPVIGPHYLPRALGGWGAQQPLCYHFIDNRQTLGPGRQIGYYTPQDSQQERLDALCQETGLTQLRSFFVEHCSQAFGLALEGHAPGSSKATWKLAFSGDCRPCQAVITNAKDADLLIHEATFEDALLEEALAKKHSLTREAVEVGAKCGAFRTLLTHFSQRYPKIPVMDPSLAASTCIASDLMRINLADLEVLPQLVPLLRQLFQEELAELEAAAAMSDPAEIDL